LTRHIVQQIQEALKRNFSRVINKIPSLGLGYLAAVLEQAGHCVTIADCSIAFDEASLLQLSSKLMPDIVGFTATTPVFSNALRLASSLRATYPGRYSFAAALMLLQTLKAH